MSDPLEGVSEWLDQRNTKILVAAAYRRGQEEMRERAAKATERQYGAQWQITDAIRALPIKEQP